MSSGVRQGNALQRRRIWFCAAWEGGGLHDVRSMSLFDLKRGFLPWREEQERADCAGQGGAGGRGGRTMNPFLPPVPVPRHTKKSIPAHFPINTFLGPAG